MEVALELTNGPRIECRRGKTVDATAANPPNQIPSATDSFEAILVDFPRKGFTRNEAIARNFGGHALGQFVNGPGPDSTQFDPTPALFDNILLKFLAQKCPLGNFTVDSFNPLPSCQLLVENAPQLARELASNVLGSEIQVQIVHAEDMSPLASAFTSKLIVF